MNQRLFSRAAIALVATCALLGGAVAQAAPDFKLKIEWDGRTWNSSPTNMILTQDPNNPNVYSFTGGFTHADWNATWAGSLDEDPAINSGIAFTNALAVPQTFVMTMTLPTVGAIPAPSTILGGTTVTVSGAGQVETASAPAGDFVYRAATGSGGFVGPPADLLPPPFSLSTLPGGLPNSIPPVTFGPAPGPGLNAVDSISIRHAITLTPGGTATLNGTFILEIPEPASLALLPLAGLAVARRRRK